MRTNDGARCSACSIDYGYSRYGSLDLRPRKRKSSSVEFQIDPPSDEIQSWHENLVPLVHDNELKEWYRDRWPARPSEPSVGLELGTADILQNNFFTESGFEYLGVDYEATHAMMLVDAHALPFRDNSFPFIVAYAFLEHLQFPAVAMLEVCRVLKPGGAFIGTVSFLEPFHMNSFYHHTHLGLINTLKSAGFADISVVPTEQWNGLLAVTNMALFPRASVRFARGLVAPLKALHRLWWWFLRRSGPGYSEATRIRNSTGAFNFYGSKR